jgi:hypothetical protein
MSTTNMFMNVRDERGRENTKKLLDGVLNSWDQYRRESKKKYPRLQDLTESHFETDDQKEEF